MKRRYQVVIDSNVLVAGLRSRLGTSFRLLELVGDDRFELNISATLFFEYEAVLKEKVVSLGFLTANDVDDFLDYLCARSQRQKISYLWRPYLNDPHDDFVLELAVAAECDFIITFNKKDFAGSESFGVKIVSPKEFLKIIGENP